MMQHSGLIQLGSALINEFAAMGQKQHPALLFDRQLDDLAAHDGFARAGRRIDDEAPNSGLTGVERHQSPALDTGAGATYYSRSMAVPRSLSQSLRPTPDSWSGQAQEPAGNGQAGFVA